VKSTVKARDGGDGGLGRVGGIPGALRRAVVALVAEKGAARRIRERIVRAERAKEARRRTLDASTSRRLEAARESARVARREAKSLRGIVDRLPRYELGSYSPGVEAWSRRWDERPGKRILLYAFCDYAGSFYRWAEAVNETTDYAARLVVFKTHRFRFPIDLLFLNHSEEAYRGLLDLGEQADVIHVKDETGFYLGTNGLPDDLLSRFGKPQVFTHYGGCARKHANDPRYVDHVRGFDGRVAMTPDLCFEWFDGLYVPHAIDTRRFPYSWKDGRVLAHSPSIPARKGTAALIEAVRGLDLTLDIIEGVPHEESLRRKASANLFFDQAGREDVAKLGTDRVIGNYANSALEAAVRGIPTIAHLSEDFFEGAIRGGRDVRERCAIINTPLDVEGMRATVAGYFELSSEERRERSLRTREWVEEFHSYRAVGPALAAVYDELVPASGPSLAYRRRKGAASRS
jgi:hypothetical protein